MIWWIGFAVFFFVLALAWAKLEISAEGQNGYGEKFPC